MSRLECAACGLAAGDLPDDVDPELIFETEGGVTHCMHCVAQAAYVELDCGCGAKISGNPLCICRDPDDEPDWCPGCGNPAGCDGQCDDDEDDEPGRPVQDIPTGGLL